MDPKALVAVYVKLQDHPLVDTQLKESLPILGTRLTSKFLKQRATDYLYTYASIRGYKGYTAVQRDNTEQDPQNYIMNTLDFGTGTGFQSIPVNLQTISENVPKNNKLQLTDAKQLYVLHSILTPTTSQDIPEKSYVKVIQGGDTCHLVLKKNGTGSPTDYDGYPVSYTHLTLPTKA